MVASFLTLRKYSIYIYLMKKGEKREYFLTKKHFFLFLSSNLPPEVIYVGWFELCSFSCPSGIEILYLRAQNIRVWYVYQIQEVDGF